MAFDPFSSGRPSNLGSHVTFAPIPIGPEWNPDPTTWQPAPANPVMPGSGGHQPPPSPSPLDQAHQKPDSLPSQGGSQAPSIAQGQPASNSQAAMAEAFAVAMALETLTGPLGSPSTAIARKLPGSPENIFGQMEATREEEKIVDGRRELARKMAQKDDDMNYRD